MEFQTTRQCTEKSTKCVVAKLKRDGVITYVASCLPNKVHKYCAGDNKSSVFNRVDICCCATDKCNDLAKAKGCWEKKTPKKAAAAVSE